MSAEPIDEKAIFNIARRIALREARADYLQQVCGDNSQALARVAALLDVHDQEQSFLESPAVAIATIDEPPTERPGTQIGPYKLLQQIGEGGMGVVYMAEQTEPVKRRVALKIIKPGMDTRQVIARFEAERQALSLMDHPNIAKVLDAGTTGEPGSVSSGRPYFVMELVKGQPITQYCDEKHLTPRQRLELLLPVCQAIQHAHQKGIIHRDIKPTNILVAEYDQQPVPKVIDFGVAKATSQTLTEKTMFTGLGQIVGTLEYMSPEQAKVNQLDIDTRSDIYSLGVLLYELLTGSTPFDRQRLRSAAFDEMLRIIREEEPPKPSTRLSDSKDSLPSISAQRHTEPAKLTKLVRGELDWIVMKALEKDRSRRYESANGLASDIQRYLNDEPVVACPPSAGYRLRKFVRRNKTKVGMAAILGTALLLALGSIGWMVRDQAAREAKAAQQQAKVVGQVESILAEVDALESDQKWPEALAAARRAEAALAGSEADAQTTAQVRDLLKELQLIDHLEQIRIKRLADLSDDTATASSLRAYAQAFREYGVDIETLPVETSIDRLKGRPSATALAVALDDWVTAQRYADEKNPAANPAAWTRLVAIARGIDPEPMRDRLRSLWGRPVSDTQAREELQRLAESVDFRAQHPATLLILAATVTRVLDSAAAIRILREGQSVYPGDFWLNFHLGKILGAQKNYEGAVRFYTAAVAIRPQSAIALNDLGLNLAGQKKLDEASAVYRRAIEIDPKFAIPYANLAGVLLEQEKLNEAVAATHRALELDPRFAGAHANLGEMLRRQGKLKESIAACRQALEIDARAPKAHVFLGEALRDQGHPDEALASFRKALEIDGKDAHTLNNIGVILSNQKKLPEAITSFRRAIEVDPQFALAHANLGISLRHLNQHGEAIASLERAIELDPAHKNAFLELGAILCDDKKDYEGAEAIFRKTISIVPNSVDAHLNLGLALFHQQKLDESIAAFRKAIALDPSNVKAHFNLGRALRKQRKLDEAIAAFRKTIELDPKHADAYTNLGMALDEKGEFTEAAAAFRKFVEINPNSTTAYTNLGNALFKQGKLDEAVAAHRKAITIDPKDAAAYCGLGFLLYSQNKLPEAVAALRQSIDLDPKRALSYRNLADALVEQGKLDEAMAAQLKAIELDPRHAKSHSSIGYILHQQKKLDEAIHHCRKATELDPQDAAAHWNLGAYLAEKGQLPEAITSLQKAFELDPKNASYRDNLAKVHTRLGVSLERKKDLMGAIAAHKRAIALKPDYAVAHSNLGDTLVKSEQIDDAIACFRKAIELDPKYFEAYQSLLGALSHAKRYDEAIQVCRELIRAVPDSAQAYIVCANFLETRGDPNKRIPAEVLEFAKKAVELAPDFPESWQVLGWAQYRAGKWGECIKALGKSIELQKDGGDPAQWYFLAMAHWQLGQKEEARTYFDRAALWMEKNNPQNEELSRFRAEAQEVLGISKK